jgi:hypothetical protein
MSRCALIAALLLLVVVEVARAQTGATMLVKPLMDEKETWESHGDALFIGNGETSNNENFQMNVVEYQGRLREVKEPFIPRIGWDLTYLDINGDDPALQQDLIDVSVGAGLDFGVHGNWQWAAAIGGGYAGNTPFGESDAWYGMATLRVGKRISEKTALAIVIDYDGNRSIYPDIPLPGFALRHQYSPNLAFVLGVPVSSIYWNVNQRTHVNVNWTLIDSFDADVRYELSPKWNVYTALEARSEAFSVDGTSGDDRLLFQQRRVEAGVQWKPWAHTRLVAALGYTIGGEFSIGFDQRDSDLVADLSDEPYVRIGFERRF